MTHAFSVRMTLRSVALAALALLLNTNALALDKYRLKTNTGTTLVDVRVGRQLIKVVHTEQEEPREFSSKPKVKPGQRPYRSQGNDIRFQVREAPAGFNLNNASGELRWAAVREKNVQFGNSAGGEAQYEFVLKSPTQAEIRHAGELLGRVRFYPKKAHIKIKSAANQTLFKARSTTMLVGFGVVLFEGMEADEKYVLMAELLARKW